MVSASSDFSIIRHMVSRVRERGVGIAGAGAQLFSFSLQSELLLEQEMPAELDDADRHLFRVEPISLAQQATRNKDTTNIFLPYKPGTDRYNVSTLGLALLEALR